MADSYVVADSLSTRPGRRDGPRHSCSRVPEAVLDRAELADNEALLAHPARGSARYEDLRGTLVFGAISDHCVLCWRARLATSGLLSVLRARVGENRTVDFHLRMSCQSPLGKLLRLTRWLGG